MPRRASAWEEHEDDLSRLLTRLDPDASRAQEKYVEMYRKLLRIFEWHGCLHPEEAADDTINQAGHPEAGGECRIRKKCFRGMHDALDLIGHRTESSRHLDRYSRIRV